MFRNNLQRLVLFFGLGAALLALGGCNNSSGGQACVSDIDCTTGQICGTNKKCQAVYCTTRLDCPGISTCHYSGRCGPEECVGNDQCPTGGVCREKACFPANTSCTSDQQCATGYKCIGGVCTQYTPPDCGPGGTCTGGLVCNPQNSKCEPCSLTLPCLPGYTCNSGICEAPTTNCVTSNDCIATGRVCDPNTNQCDSCSPALPCPGTYLCNPGGVCIQRTACDATHSCTAPEACDTTVQLCVTPNSRSICQPCISGLECGGANKCFSVSGGMYCLNDCSSAQCPQGYTCSPDHGSLCIPIGSRCERNCNLTGCGHDAARPNCNTQTGLCEASKKLCDACNADDECGAVFDKCLDLLGTGAKVCSKDCSTTGTCPNGFICDQNLGPPAQCKPTGASCTLDQCYGVLCNQDPAKPHCDPADGQCYACVVAAHCLGTTCVNHVCQGSGGCTSNNDCTNPLTPHCLVAQNRCVQCLNAGHCSGGNCVNNYCQGGGACGSFNCSSANDCVSGGCGELCDTALGGICVYRTGECVADYNCRPGQQCKLGALTQKYWCQGCSDATECAGASVGVAVTCLLTYCSVFGL